MSWMVFALIGYFLGAVTNVLDKYILSARIPSPPVYAFFAAMFTILSLFVIAPFGFSFIYGFSLAAAILSGFLFIYGLLFFYKAVKVSEVSRVAPLAGTLTALGTLLAVVAVSDAEFDSVNMASFWFLTVGGFLIVFDLPLKPRIMFQGLRTIIVASFLLGASVASLKYVYGTEGFINGYGWSRIGEIIGGFTLLLFPVWRREIIENIKKPAVSKKESAKTGAWFVANKLSGALSAFAVSYAVFLGPLTMVHALSGAQYAFVFMIVIVLSRWKPMFMGEHLLLNDWIQKWIALVFIGIGLYLASVGGVLLA